MANTTKPKTIKDRAFFAAIGQKGGLTTKRRKLEENPNYYSEIGLKGGDIMKKTRGKEFYSQIGKMGKRDTNRPAAESTDQNDQQDQ
jgi:general stress protein YciG